MSDALLLPAGHDQKVSDQRPCDDDSQRQRFSKIQSVLCRRQRRSHQSRHKNRQHEHSQQQQPEVSQPDAPYVLPATFLNQA